MYAHARRHHKHMRKLTRKRTGKFFCSCCCCGWSIRISSWNSFNFAKLQLEKPNASNFWGLQVVILVSFFSFLRQNGARPCTLRSDSLTTSPWLRFEFGNWTRNHKRHTKNNQIWKNFLLCVVSAPISMMIIINFGVEWARIHSLHFTDKMRWVNTVIAHACDLNQWIFMVRNFCIIIFARLALDNG